MPDPADVERYQALIPDAGERLLRVVESSTVDVSRRDDKLVDAEIAAAHSSRAAAYTFTVLAFGLATMFFLMGNIWAGLAFLGFPVLGLIQSILSTHIQGRRRRDPELGDGS